MSVMAHRSVSQWRNGHYVTISKETFVLIWRNFFYALLRLAIYCAHYRKDFS
jgi:hypothetical protein